MSGLMFVDFCFPQILLLWRGVSGALFFFHFFFAWVQQIPAENLVVTHAMAVLFLHFVFPTLQQLVLFGVVFGIVASQRVWNGSAGADKQSGDFVRIGDG